MDGGNTLKRWTLGVAVLLGAGLLAGFVATSHQAPRKPIESGRDLRWKKAPPLTINVNKTFVADFTTTAGNFQMTLFAKQDPVAANNFVFLARHHFYNGDTFFRVIKPFMVQTGDPLNNGTGGPGYSLHAELPPTVPYSPGVVSMAHAASPNSNGSQFFICTGAECAGLNQKGYNTYTEIGRITQGLAVVDKIANGKVKANPLMGGEVSKPLHPYTIKNITIKVKRA